MPQPSPDAAGRTNHLAWSRFALLLFGIATLAFLIVIDREEWFHIKPATGTAAAMSHAGTPARAVQGS